LNPQNFQLIFTQDQLSVSLRASLLKEIVLRATVIMDVEQLHADIKSHITNDLASVAGITAASSGQPSHWTINSSSMLWCDECIWVPIVTGKALEALRVRVLQHMHDHILSSHFGQNRTLALVRREYAWLELWTFVQKYCKSCIVCKRNKAPQHRPYSLLKPLPIPLRPWHSISMDFIEQLPLSSEFDCILVICDRSSKQVILILCDVHITSAGLAWLFVFSKHGVPSHVTCDRGTEFISAFFRSLAKLLSMEMHYTSSYHPLADGQTVEQYIQIFCSYQQDDWDKLLPLAEFALNNAPNAYTGISPFFVNKGYNLAITVHLERDVANTYAKYFAVDLQDLHQFLREQITFACDRYKETADWIQVSLSVIKFSFRPNTSTPLGRRRSSLKLSSVHTKLLENHQQHHIRCDYLNRSPKFILSSMFLNSNPIPRL
jgi:hypothetical protein